MGVTRVSADVSLCSAVWGDYVRFLPGWFEMVGRLDPAPAEVIVATFPEHVDDLRGYPCQVVFEDLDVPAGQYDIPWMLNLSAWSARHSWLANLAIDDELLPDGLAGLDSTDADIVSVSAITTNGVYVQARGEANLRVVAEDMVLGPSFIRTDLFKRVAGWRTNVMLSDWQLWVDAYLAGGRLVTWDRPTHRIDIDSPGRFSSDLVADGEKARLREQMRAALAAGVR